MTPQRWTEIRRIFDEALERPVGDRTAFIESLCGADRELRREVDDLLASYAGSEGFLETPAADLNRAVLSSGSLSAEIEYPRGFMAGPYQLQRPLGRGGMGSVWLATRSDGGPEQVAIKLVKRGMDTRDILRRFRVERAALASLEHPHIARLLDAGSTSEGLPYLVMEYVEGTPIDQYCETQNSSVTERLRLFRQVCDAVQYAHRKLVVHRDLKGNNILVTRDGVPKLLDFGIAKLLRTDDTSENAETRPEQRAMTLDYASPEQVRGEPVATATDVYSLGVLLYRLLTGKNPYRCEPRSTEQLRRAICEEEPLRPSSAVIMKGRVSARLKEKLSGDLDVIVLMALRKEPERRYQSVEHFSEDIRRYLEGMPVQARDGSLAYRASKFLRRNAVMVAASMVVAIALISLAGVSLYYEREAERQSANSLRLQLELQGELLRAYLSTPNSPDDYRKALEVAQRVLRVNPAQIEATRAVITAAHQLGAAQFQAGDYRAALTTFDLAFKAGEDPRVNDRPSRQSLAACNFYVGEILARMSERDGALVNLRRAVELYRGFSPPGAGPRVRETTVEGFQRALRDYAAKAPPEIRGDVASLLD